MFAETRRSMSLRFRIASDYFETELPREPFDQFRISYFVARPEHPMVFDVSQVIRLAERLIVFPSFQRWNKDTVPPVRRRSVSYTTYPSGQSTSAGCSDRAMFEDSRKRRAKIGAKYARCEY
jgi:hypothetical protein